MSTPPTNCKASMGMCQAWFLKGVCGAQPLIVSISVPVVWLQDGLKSCMNQETGRPRKLVLVDEVLLDGNYLEQKKQFQGQRMHTVVLESVSSAWRSVCLTVVGTFAGHLARILIDPAQPWSLLSVGFARSHTVPRGSLSDGDIVLIECRVDRWWKKTLLGWVARFDLQALYLINRPTHLQDARLKKKAKTAKTSI
ncbi:hypothetical protein OBBRIDRAFT_858480 [Obba rivulosa]|uniref:Uncharacterized protein n=1 Tax=Obba rivulosa TaxID=1052685 RepID=A0A8E2AS03_9APHY|nr:hypothetical protein OBBRIDRAFT_858480 [Obba rivulosa]